jgi:ATP-dependent Clp protease ATP-binding subunit ClpC
VRIDHDALRDCVRLSVRFLPERRLPDKALDLLDEACAEAHLSGDEVVGAQTVAKVVSERTGVPVHTLTTEERRRLQDLETWLAERIIGQDEAVSRLAAAVRLSRAGLHDPDRPRGVFLFAGASGVGKTALAKALADFLFPEGQSLVRLDMSEYTDKFTGSRLLGAPPGYAGHGDEGLLSGPLRRRPYAVVLLDEFEKAHPDVQSMFLSLFDEGVITDSEGRRVEAKEAFFILTTNAGSEQSSQQRVGFGGSSANLDREAVLDRVRPFFRPELLNRIDEVVPFRPLAPADLVAIARLELSRLARRSAAEGVELTWDDEVASLLARHKPDPKFGARPVLRALDTLVAAPLGRIVVEGDSPAQHAWHVAVRDGEVVFEEGSQLQQQAGQSEPVPAE